MYIYDHVNDALEFGKRVKVYYLSLKMHASVVLFDSHIPKSLHNQYKSCNILRWSTTGCPNS